MMNQKQAETNPPRGVMATIAAGFDLVTKHWGILLLPILLDLFYWLGPRLTLTSLLEQGIAFWQEQAAAMEMTGVDFAMFTEVAPRINLFASLSVPFVGVPAFMAGFMPEESLLATRFIELTSGGMVFVLFVGLNLVGLLLTAVYYHSVSIAIGDREVSLANFIPRVGRSWFLLIAFGLALLLAMFIMYIPLAIISAVAALLSPVLAVMVLFMVPVLLGWLLIYFFFTPQGIVLSGRSLWSAMLESMMMVQQHLSAALTFILAVILIGQLLDWLLLMATDGSWFTIVSILAHAFVSTALVAASFIFYQERLAIVLLVNHRLPIGRQPQNNETE